MPEGMRHDGESGVPCWVSDAEKIRISKDDEVRLKIIGSRVDATQLVCKYIACNYIAECAAL